MPAYFRCKTAVRFTPTGFEIELNGRPFPWLEATASYAFQKSNDYDADGILENSPDHLAKLRFAVPLGRKFDASSSMQYYSKRRTLAGNYVTPVYLADFTITSKHLFPTFDVQFGIRNAFNRNYSDPIALTPWLTPYPNQAAPSTSTNRPCSAAIMWAGLTASSRPPVSPATRNKPSPPTDPASPGKPPPQPPPAARASPFPRPQSSAAAPPEPPTPQMHSHNPTSPAEGSHFDP